MSEINTPEIELDDSIYNNWYEQTYRENADKFSFLHEYGTEE